MILTDADQLREALRVALEERDEARVEALGIAQQLELEREDSAQLRAEAGERMRETAEAQREACAAQARAYTYLRVDADTMLEEVRATPLVTDSKADGGTT